MHEKVFLADKNEIARLRDSSKNNQLYYALHYLHSTIREKEVLVLIDGLPAASVKDNGNGWVFSVIMGKYTKATLANNVLHLTDIDEASTIFNYKADTNSWAQVSASETTPPDPSILN